MAYPPPSPTSTLLSLSRHQAHLESHIQYLLDAQSTGLLSGLGHGLPPSSAGTNTPTSTHSPARSHNAHPSSKSAHFSSTRQEPEKPLNLHTARRGLSRAIADLAALKAQEADILQSELSSRSEEVSHIANLTTKQEGLRSAIDTILNESSSHKLDDFKTEEQTLSHEILELEERLQQMKNRQRYLLREISGLENRTQAKLSSYRESLRLAEREAREWLARPPARLEKARAKKEEGSIWSLSKERRTLEMAREWTQTVEQEYRAKVEAVEKEREALEEGGEVWKEVREVVARVEKGLRGEMDMQTSRRRGKDKESEGMRRILGDMEAAKREIEGKLAMAEEKGWRLLVCCVGAELEALVEGMDVLSGALEGIGGNNIHHGGEDLLQQHDGHGEIREGDLLGETNGLEKMGQSMNGVSIGGDTSPSHETSRRSEDEDDGPGPDLLISHQEEE